METFFLESGLSWTMSKVVPYVIIVVAGLLIALILKRYLKSVTKYLRWLLILVIFALPFGVYFIIEPIYQGDFSNDVVEVEKSADYDEFTGKKIVVISIPGCKYCFEAMDELMVMKNRVEEIEIEYVVCSPDSNTINWYKEKAGESINVRLAKNPDALLKLADFAFPTFILVDNNKPLKKWSNDSFGVFAKDEVELEFN